MHSRLLPFAMISMLSLSTACPVAAVSKIDETAALSPGAHEFAVGDVNIWYRVAGRRTGTPVVFLHGGPGEGSQVFQAYGGPELEKTERMVYLDQRGAGHSDRPKDVSAYSIPIMVDDIERLREHLAVSKMALLGHSFGTQLALEYASKYPSHVAALILAGATPYLLRSLDLQCERLQQQDQLAYARAIKGLPPKAFPRCDTRKAYSGDAAKTFTSSNLFPDAATAKKVEALDNAEGARNTGEAAGSLFRQGLLSYQFKDARKIAAPVLIIAGEKDHQAALAVQQDLVRDLPHARLLVYPDNGHFMFVEAPHRFARDVTAFLRKAAR